MQTNYGAQYDLKIPGGEWMEKKDLSQSLDFFGCTFSVLFRVHRVVGASAVLKERKGVNGGRECRWKASDQAMQDGAALAVNVICKDIKLPEKKYWNIQPYKERAMVMFNRNIR